MPYEIREDRNSPRPFKIVRKDDGKVVGSSQTRAKAESSIKHRMGGEKKR